MVLFLLLAFQTLQSNNYCFPGCQLFFFFIGNTNLCLFFFLPWEISTRLQKGCMTLIYNRITPFLLRGGFFFPFFSPSVFVDVDTKSNLPCVHIHVIWIRWTDQQFSRTCLGDSSREFISDTSPFKVFNIHSCNISNRPYNTVLKNTFFFFFL